MDYEETSRIGLAGLTFLAVLLASLSWFSVMKAARKYRATGTPMHRGTIFEQLEAAAMFTGAAGLLALAAWLFPVFR